MGTNRKNNTFDCLEFKDKAQERIYKAIKDMTPEEQREFFRTHAERGPLGEWWKAVKRTSKRTADNRPSKEMRRLGT